jgi:hypothetical protein
VRIGFADIPQQQHELITTQPPDHVGCADMPPEHANHSLSTMSPAA